MIKRKSFITLLLVMPLSTAMWAQTDTLPDGLGNDTRSPDGITAGCFVKKRERTTWILSPSFEKTNLVWRPMLYMFDPMRFGAGAYRHFSSTPEPTSVVRGVLAGKALTD